MTSRKPQKKLNILNRAVESVKDVLHYDKQLWHIGATIPINGIYVPDIKPREKGKKKKSLKQRLLPVLKHTRHPQEAADQSASLILQLPVEIRKLIWTEVIGRRLLFGGTVVDLTSEYVCRSSNDFVQFSTEWKQKSLELLNLLMTCQQIRDEASSLLYSTNLYYHIAIDRLGRVEPASPRLLPPLQHLRALVFECNVDSVLFKNGLFIFRPSSKPFTTETWSIFSQMPTLQTLLINIVSHASVFDTNGQDAGNSESQVFAPLMDIAHLQVFEVVVRWKCPYKQQNRVCQLQNDYSEAPFRLTEILDHVIRDEVVQGGQEMVDVRAWAAAAIEAAKDEHG